MQSFALNIQDLIGVLIVYQGLQFSVNLLINKTRKADFNIILALCIGSLSLNFLNMLLLSLGVMNLNFGPFFGLSYGPIFLLYTKALIYADQRFSRRDLVHFIPALIILPALPFLGSLLSDPVFGIVVTVFIGVHIGTYLTLAYRKVMWFQKSLENLISLVASINLSWLKFLILSIAGLFLIVMVESLVSQNVTLDNLTIILIYVFVLLFLNRIYAKGLRQPEIFKGITAETNALTNEIDSKYKSSKLEEQQALDYAHHLSRYMKEKRPFLEYELSLEELAARTNIPARYLSQIINERYKKNFFDFVNNYRIEEAKRLLLDKSLDLRINEVMYDSGFNSKSTFNAVFKKAVGATPSEFRRAESE